MGQIVSFVVVAAETESTMLVALAILFLVLALTTVGLISSTLSGIYSAAVYRYAVQGETGGYFDAELVQSTFRQN